MARHPSTHCVYCGGFLPKQPGGRRYNRDHAVGRQLFLNPRPSNLIVVPSCRACNAGYKEDEDYFRTMLFLTDAAGSKVGTIFHETIGMRVFDHDVGLAAKIAGGVRRARLISPRTRRTVKECVTQKVDWRGIGRVAEKWIRGLHWEIRGERLPKDLRVDVGYQPFRDDQALAYAKGWPSIFEYACVVDERDHHRMKWLFRVWDRFGVVASTNSSLGVIPTDLYDPDFPGHIVEYGPAFKQRPVAEGPLIVVPGFER